MLPCQHVYCISCLKTILDKDLWFCPCCRRPITVKFCDLERPRTILYLMDIVKIGISEIHPEELKKIHDFAKEKEKTKLLLHTSTYSPGLMGFMDWGDF